MRWDLLVTLSLNRLASIQAAAAPIGRLTKKIQRQEMYWENMPPSAGPMTAAIPQTLAM